MLPSSDLTAARRKRGRSLRLAAQRRYMKQTKRGAKPAAKSAVKAGTAAPLKIPTPLTLKVRALYEAGIVPVTEIARLAGVSERTLYKYVRRGGWKRRYARRALMKGTGGRYISRAEAAKPQPSGLKALDPALAARAEKHCAAAGRAARRTARQVLASETVLREFETRVRSLGHLTQVWRFFAASPRKTERL